MSEYSEDFEEEKFESKNPVETNRELQEDLPEEEHHLRMSLELHSVKDLTDSFSLYLKFNYKLLGSRRTQPVLVRKNIECRIENAFQANEFFMAKSALYSTLASTPLVLELWHSDKYSKDSQIGTVTVQMDQVLKAPLKKTNSSVLRALDTWCEILNPAPIGWIRVIVYLEDLGRKRQGAVLAQTENPEDYRAVWELELWKRAEEAKWQASLKAKEIEHIANLAVEWQERENKREGGIQKLANTVAELGTKVKNKALELQKREKNAGKMEETKKMKINECVRMMTLKEDEIQNIRGKISEFNLKYNKEHKALDFQLEKQKNELNNAEETLKTLKRDQDFASVSKLKQEIEETISKNLALRRDIELFSQQKNILKVNCENIRNEFVKILKDYEEEKKVWEIKEIDKISKLESELEKIKAEAIALRKSEEKENTIVRGSCSCYKLTDFVETKEEAPEIKRLRTEIDMLVGSGMYNDEDAIVKELKKQLLSFTV